MLVTCEQCGTEFQRTPGNIRSRTFCDKACYTIWIKAHPLCYWKGKHRDDETKAKLAESQRGKVASSETKAKLRGRIPWNKGKAGLFFHTDEWKKENSKRLKGNRYSFGRPCPEWKKARLRQLLSGPASHLWKGGLTPVTSRIRASYRYRGWRRAVLRRDRFTCVLCGQKGGNLNADHYPKAFSEMLDELRCIYPVSELQKAAFACAEMWDVNNGRTLCITCHRDTPNYLVNGRHVKRIRGV